MGPALALVAPYLVHYRYPGGLVRTGQYNPNLHADFAGIIGTGGFMESMSQTSLKVGGSFKTSLSVELGTFRNQTSGVEAGLAVDCLADGIIIMPRAENRAVYLTAFIMLFYGLGK